MQIETIETQKRLKRVFTEVDSKFLEFKPGCRVLSAEMEFMNDSTSIFFVKKHEPNTKYWKEGGFECQDEFGHFRAFHLDGLVIHPTEFVETVTITKEGVDGEMRRRGRPRIKPITVEDIEKPKGKRGRKPLSPEVKAQRDLEKSKEVVGDKRGRGRPKLALELRKTKPYQSKGFGKRGRPSKAMIELLKNHQTSTSI